MAKLKLKKEVSAKVIIGVILLGVIAFLGFKLYKDYQYKQTTLYKLTKHGYTLEEAKKLESYFQEEDLINILNKEKNSTIVSLIEEKYYIHKNLDRYLEYQDKNKDKSLNDVVAIVNVYQDYKHYEHDIESDTSLGILLNVNKYFYITENFEPLDISNISLRYSYEGNKINKEANDAYISMWNAANSDGYTLIVNSSFRDYDTQTNVYDNIKASKGTKEADKVAARPGHSEHQTGLAIDVFEINNQSTETFKDSPAYTWLLDNAYKYGFIERYPENKEYLTGYSFEAWHWRYVGEEVAKKIHDENITFDEYYAFYIENQA